MSKRNVKKIIFLVLSIIISIVVCRDFSITSYVANGVDAANEKYLKEMQKVLEKFVLDDVYNLPSQYKQTTEHPYPTDYFGLNADEKPIFKVKVAENDFKRKNCMSITFDSAYINDYTYKILDILDEYDVKATFFMTHNFMTKNNDQIMEIIKRGHEIGNHSNTHPDFNKITDAKVVAEVMQPHNYIKNLLGIDMCLFRFPYGSYSPRTVALLKNMGYYPIQWTFDSVDWKNEGKDFLIERFKDNENLSEGAIILFHNGAKYTPEALPEILEMIKAKGLRCVKVSDLIHFHDFSLLEKLQVPK